MAASLRQLAVGVRSTGLTASCWIARTTYLRNPPTHIRVFVQQFVDGCAPYDNKTARAPTCRIL